MSSINDALEWFRKSPESKEAQEALYIQYYPHLRHIIRGYTQKDNAVDADDLMQEAFFALIKAAKNYDVSRGKSFKKYCAWHVKKAITKALRARYFVDENGVQKWYVQKPLYSLDEPVTEEDGATRGELLSDPDAIDPEEKAVNADTAARIWALIDELPNEQSRLMRMRYGYGGTVAGVAQKMGMTYARAYAMEGHVLQHLRKAPAVRQIGHDLNYYMKKSINSFRNDHTSVTELLAFKRMGEYK